MYAYGVIPRWGRCRNRRAESSEAIGTRGLVLEILLERPAPVEVEVCENALQQAAAFDIGNRRVEYHAGASGDYQRAGRGHDHKLGLDTSPDVFCFLLLEVIATLRRGGREIQLHP